MSKKSKLSPEAKKAVEIIRRCVAAVPRREHSTRLKDFKGSVVHPRG